MAKWIGLIHFMKMMLVLPFAILARKRDFNIWIITERKNQARDNGLVFYRYVKTVHPEQPIKYIIDQNSKDYNKIVKYGDIIQFNSWRHYFFYCLSPIHISTQIGGCIPEHNPYSWRIKKITQHKDVFIPHGVSYGISDFCLSQNAKVDVFISCSIQEYENIKKNYGYKPEQVILTGFPRFDVWHHIQVNKRQILLMPTWRRYLARGDNTVIEQTDFYLFYQHLINNPNLDLFLKTHQIQLVFYLHHEMQKYASAFSSGSKNIKIVVDESKYDIQELLMESALLITDYSSVHFDFAYMDKPVIYYQFDQKEFFEKQYLQSDFKAEKDGFGPVFYHERQVIEYIKKTYESGFKTEEQYRKNMLAFFGIYDDNNNDRVYEAISSISNGKYK